MAKKQKAYKVKATDTGIYGGRRIYEGTVFFISEPRFFSDRWMKDLTSEKNLSTLGRQARAALERERVAALKAKPKSAKVKVEDEVVEDDETEDETEDDEPEGDEGGDDGSEEDESEDGEGEEESLIMGALQQLDHDEDKHWTQGGLPDVNTVAKILNDGDIELTRVKLNQVAPDFKREQGE